MGFKEDFMEGYNETLYKKVEKKIPPGPVNMETIYEEIERLKPRLDKLDKLITPRERVIYWRNNIYKFNRDELKMIPLELKNRYIEHYIRILSYQFFTPTLIFAIFLIVLGISLLYTL